MATLTITTTYTPSTKPTVSSPLASTAPPTRIVPKRQLSNAPAFPTSRPLRPFPSINTSIKGISSSGSAPKKPTKIIEPPKNFRGQFVLNLTQAELSRQD